MIIAIAGPRGAATRALLGATLDTLAPQFIALGDGTPDLVLVTGDEPGLADALAALPAETVVYGFVDDSAVVTATTGIAASVVTFGLSGSARVRAEAIEATRAGTSLRFVGDGESAVVTVGVLGESIAPLAAAAVAVAASLGVPTATAIAALAGVHDVGPGDMQVSRPAPGILVINDASDGSPLSTTQALKALAQLTIDGTRSVAVLGDLDLGDDTDPIASREEHDRIGRLVVRLNVSRLIVVGQSARHIHNAAGLEGSWDGESVLVDTADEAYDLLNDTEFSAERAQTDLVLLVKSSQAAALGAIGDRITRTLEERRVTA